jgi:hypothetical protein
MYVCTKVVLAFNLLYKIKSFRQLSLKKFCFWCPGNAVFGNFEKQSLIFSFDSVKNSNFLGFQDQNANPDEAIAAVGTFNKNRRCPKSQQVQSVERRSGRGCSFN